MIKCIVCDLDGTLINIDDTIESSTLTILREYMNKGIELILATGRSKNMVVDITKNYQLDCDLILNNGTTYYSPKQNIEKLYPMPDIAATKIIQILHDHGYLQAIHTNKGIYSLHDRDSFWDYHMQLLRKSPTFKEAMPKKTFTTKHKYLKEFHHFTSIPEILNNEIQILKIDARHIELSSMAGLKNKLLIPDLDISSSYGENIEITSSASNKGKLLKEVIASKGYQEDEIAVFGDGENDVSMLQDFKYSFAPKNACDEAKQASNMHLHKTNFEGAVGEGLLLLKELQLL